MAVTGFILSHGFDFIFNYLLTNENKYKKYNAFSLFFDARIIVIHVSIVLSAFAIQFSPGSTFSGHAVGSYLALFIFVRIFLPHEAAVPRRIFCADGSSAVGDK